jgi:hypothetical protein
MHARPQGVPAAFWRAPGVQVFRINADRRLKSQQRAAMAGGYVYVK